MKRSTVTIKGAGDACARSTVALFPGGDDPEDDFESELVAALEEHDAQAAELELGETVNA